MKVRAAIGAPLLMAGAGLRSSARDAVVVALVVALTALLVSLAPLWFGRAADDVLRSRLAVATEAQRGLEFELRGRLDPVAGDPLATAAALGADLAADLPPTLAAAAPGPDLLVDAQELLAIGAPRPILRLTLRTQDVDGGIRWVAGRPPGPTTAVIDVPDRPTADGEPPKAIAYEAAISTATAAATDLGVGDRVLLVPGTNMAGFVAVDVVGLFEVADPAAGRWFSDPTLVRTVDERVSQEVTIYHAVALVNPGAYPALHGASGSPGALPLPFRYRWRFRLDPARLPVEQSDAIGTELARLRAGHPFFGASATPGLSTGLAELVARYRSDRAAAATAVAVALVGPLAAMLGMLALLVATGQRRRDAALRAVRSRGGGIAQAVAGRTLEVGAVAGPAALAGGVLAGLVVGGVTPAGLAPALAVGLAVMTFAALAAAASARRPSVGRETGPGGRTRERRLVLDLLVVAIAVGAAIMLRGRDEGGIDDLDLVVAAVPVLLALAGGIVVLRAYPAVVRILARATAGRAGLVAVHALRGVERGAAGHGVPLVALVLAVATGVVAVLVVGTLDQATGRAAAARAGADFRVEQRIGSPLPPGLDLRSVPGVRASASAARADGRLIGAGRVSVPVDLIVLDVAAWLDVVDGLPLDGVLPPELAARPLVDAGSPDSPADALVGAATLARLALAPGEVGQLTVGGRTIAVRVTAAPSELPGLGPADEIVLLDRATADVALPGATQNPYLAFLRAPETAGDALAAEVLRYAPEVVMASRAAVLRELRDAPLAEAIRAGYGVALAIALLYAVAIVALAARRAALARRRELAVLRVLGLPPGGLTRMLALEVAPLVVAALTAGAALGTLIAALVLPGLGLDHLLGLAGAPTLAADVPVLLLLAAAPIAGAAAAIIGSARGARRADLADATRAVEA